MKPEFTLLIGDYDYAQKIRAGRTRSNHVNLAVARVQPVHAGFRAMARETAFDLAELAIVTALQALQREAPIIILPGVLAARFQRDRLITLSERQVSDPRELIGQRIGVRSYAQTTGVWVRAALWEDFGIGSDAVCWRTIEGAHVGNYDEPPFVERDRSGVSLLDQLRIGNIAAAVMGSDLPETPEFVRVIPNYEDRDRISWERQGFVPPNHILTANRASALRNPEAVREIYHLIRVATEVTRTHDDGPASTLFGIESMIAPLEATIEEALRQQLISRRFSATELLEPAARLLQD